MKYVYALTYNKCRDYLGESTFYSNRKKARAALKILALDRSSNTAIEIHDNTKDLFSFVTLDSDDLHIYSIVKITVE